MSGGENNFEMVKSLCITRLDASTSLGSVKDGKSTVKSSLTGGFEAITQPVPRIYV